MGCSGPVGRSDMGRSGRVGRSEMVLGRSCMEQNVQHSGGTIVVVVIVVVVLFCLLLLVSFQINCFNYG